MKPELAPPHRRHLIGELFAARDMLGAPGAILRAAGKPKAETQALRVMVFPGYGANDFSTAPLRYFLSKHGFRSEGWGLGLNTGGRGGAKRLDELSDRWEVDRTRETNGEAEVPGLIDRASERVAQRARETGDHYALVGWSLGGFIAREIARDMPEEVATVITMGSPVVGGPKYTSVAPLFRARNIDLDWVESEIQKRFAKPITQPVTALYSKRDGIVGWPAAIDHDSPNVRHIELDVSHFGIGVNARAWDIVLDALLSASP
ncbi:MAG: hypothetical protein HKP25_02820 [Marinicaulis sp.]|nr:hypothetical protein [Marinicaulis sp.]